MRPRLPLGCRGTAASCVREAARRRAPREGIHRAERVDNPGGRRFAPHLGGVPGAHLRIRLPPLLTRLRGPRLLELERRTALPELPLEAGREAALRLRGGEERGSAAGPLRRARPRWLWLVRRPSRSGGLLARLAPAPGAQRPWRREVVTRARFERATPSFGGWCSIQAELPGRSGA